MDITSKSLSSKLDIVAFIRKNGGEYYYQLPLDILFDLIDGHRKYGTWIEIEDKDGIAAIARWNVEQDGQTAYVLDVIIREGSRGLGPLCYLAEVAKKHHPELKYIKFLRGEKYPDREMKVIPISRLLRRSELWAEEAKQRL